MKEGSTMTGAIIALVLGLAVGGGVGYAVAVGIDDETNENQTTKSTSEDNPATGTKAADLRVTLNQVMRQHVALASVALKNLASDAPGAEASVKALDNNSVEIAGAVGAYYGEEAQADFLKLWRAHIGFFVDYTNAAVEGDEEAMDKAKADIEGYTEDASTFFAEANPNINKQELKERLQTHGNQVFAIIDAYAAKDYQEAFTKEEEAYNHIGMAADNLANAIVMQYPEQF